MTAAVQGGSSGSGSSRPAPAVAAGARAKVASVPGGPLQQRLGTALLGTGQRAREGYGPAILQNPGFHLRALWSRTQASAERFNLEVAGCSLEVFFGEEGLQSLLARPDIECCVVALPSQVQPKYVARILAHQRHVFSEKPVAPDREAAGETLKRLEESGNDGMVWFVSDPLKYEPVFQPHHLRPQDLGPIVAAEVYGVLVQERPREGPPRSDECLFIESAVSHIAVLRHVLGQVTEVNCIRLSAQEAAEPAGGAAPAAEAAAGAFWGDALSGTLCFEGGIVAAANWQTSESRQDERFRLSLWGSRGAAAVELDMGSQASAAGLRRFMLRRWLPAGGQSAAELSIPHAFASVGTEQQLEAWGSDIRAASARRHGSCSSGRGPRAPGSGEEPEPPRDRSPLNAIVDLMVVGAMLQSRGTTVRIRARQRS